VFEARFNFDLEDLKKKNLGPTIKWLEDLDGTTRGVVAFVVQASLGGHSIPVDRGTMALLKLLDLVSDKDAEKGEVPGLERAIPKSKGVEFGSLLHQLAADFSANPYSAAVKSILVEVDPTVTARLPKRRAEPSAKKSERDGEKPATEQKKAAKKEEKKTEGGEKSASKKRATTEETPAEPSKKLKAKSASAPSGKPPANGPSPRETPTAKKKSVTEGLSKRKPR
jgi:endonuclease-3